MSNQVKRIFVEKKEGFDVEARNLFQDLRVNLGLKGLVRLRIINRYDAEGIGDEEFQKALGSIFSEPPVDEVYEEELPMNGECRIIAIEYLPGQYDQRADSAAQCVQILTHGERPQIRTAKLIVMEGDISEMEYQKAKRYCINPVEAQEASMDKPDSLDMETVSPQDVNIMKGFIGLNREGLIHLIDAMGFAMSLEDLEFCQKYFGEMEKRDPSVTEIKMIDTYWSDHCRHTTFMTEIEDVKIDDSSCGGLIKSIYGQYLNSRERLYGTSSKKVCLMDIATIAMKELRAQGLLNDLDISEEINACSIKTEVIVDGEPQEWLVMFKNETHNHPTEIEPFGGAATCLGGAIRDPLSGRSYVYQAMRVTGSADPRRSVEDTIPGKLPQRKITTGAAAGYSSYGNQIGLATGLVDEIYDEGYAAKRMEIGAVIGAAPRKNVRRDIPDPGDVVILLGGRTGRDGCGGATGSSKAHTEQSLRTCGAEVQKGNPTVERKIQRLFRDPEVTTLIKRCNDFGAGGVSVAIGELAPGLDINLDAVPKKYEGLDGTELAISESQERMAVVVSEANKERFIAAARRENLEATEVAVVTGNRRLRMLWRARPIVDISRDFLDTNGASQKTHISLRSPEMKESYFLVNRRENAASGGSIKTEWLKNLGRLEVCSRKGLVERFDSTIGAATVLMPYGGKHQLTPAECMGAKIPVLEGETSTATLMAHGFNPSISRWSPFHGAVYAIVETAAKITAAGGDYRKTRLTLQEYFERLGKDPEKWGKPFAALLGAYHTQLSLGIPAIGGKDSMSGTFEDMTVPPTLVSFGVNVVDASNVISPEFKQTGSQVILVPLGRDENELPDFEQLKINYQRIYELIHDGKVLSAHTVRDGGVSEAITKMCFGNWIGFTDQETAAWVDWFAPDYGSIILEIAPQMQTEELLKDISYTVLGTTTQEELIRIGDEVISLQEALEQWEAPLEGIFPTKVQEIKKELTPYCFEREKTSGPSLHLPAPRVFIPVFPGTNCEYDTQRAFAEAGGSVDVMVFRNLTPQDIDESLAEMEKRIQKAQILMIPGGFSGGDEPDGSGKFIATAFRNPKVREAVMSLIQKRDGLILGICNGFQALIKLGLLPYGEIRDMDVHSPTLTYNTLGRHISQMVTTKVVSNLSPWLHLTKVGETHTVAVSHGEGRFTAGWEDIARMKKNGQIATQYVDLEGKPTYDIHCNPNGSLEAVEGITSPDGRVFGKMGHSERKGNEVAKNVPGKKDQRIFEAGVRYFR